MLITRKSCYSGVIRTLDVPVTLQQLQAYEAGMHAQEAMPDLTPDQREFIMTGITQEEWDRMFFNDADKAQDEQGIR